MGHAFMIINNWPAITDMMVNCADGDIWPRIYFMVFYVLVQWIILNIVIAMMLEIFCSVEGNMDTEFGRLQNIKKLRSLEKQVGTNRFREFCDGVNERIMKAKQVESRDRLNSHGQINGLINH